MKTSLYKLGEYKIIVHDVGELSWESHVGFGEMQEGRCFKKGGILFIGPSENTCLSYLKLEYLDHINNLPEWEKTEYYCTSNEIYHCNTGKRVSKEEMSLWKYDTCMNKNNLRLKTKQDELEKMLFLKAPGHKAFRLKKFEIIKKTDGQVFWRSYSGRTTGKGGVCIVLEDILFIGPSENVQHSFDKREFLSVLNKLQKWDQTKYYCPKYILHECKKQSLACEVKKNRPSYRMEAEKQFLEGENKFRNGIKTYKSALKKSHYEISKIPPLLLETKANGEDNQRLSHLDAGQSIGLKSKTLYGASSDKKWLSVAAGIFLLAILIILLFLAGPRNEQWDYRQKEHPPRYREYR